MVKHHASSTYMDDCGIEVNLPRDDKHEVVVREVWYGPHHSCWEIHRFCDSTAASMGGCVHEGIEVNVPRNGKYEVVVREVWRGPRHSCWEIHRFSSMATAA